MKLLRYGPPGHEKPAVLTDGGDAADVSDHVDDFDPDFFAQDGLSTVRALVEAGDLPRVELR